MDVGSHCSVGACAQVDFLPFTCDCCTGVFCLQHRSYDAHECPRAGGKDRRVLQCPLCRQLVRWTAEQDVNEVWEHHVRAGQCVPATPGASSAAASGDALQPKKKKKKRCAADGCRELLLASNSFHCAKCRRDVCLRHRFESDHACAAARQAQRQQHWSGFRAPAAPSTAASATAATARKSVATAASGAKSAVQSLVQSAKSAASGGAASAEQCPMCQRRFQYVSQLIAHVNREHPDPSSAPHRAAPAAPSAASSATAGSETCPQCRAEFPDLSALIRHAEAAHAGSGVTASSDQDKCALM